MQPTDRIDTNQRAFVPLIGCIPAGPACADAGALARLGATAYFVESVVLLTHFHLSDPLTAMLLRAALSPRDLGDSRRSEQSASAACSRLT